MTLSAPSRRVDLVAVERPRLGNNTQEKQRGCPTRRVHAWEVSTPSRSIPSLVPSEVFHVKSPSLQKRRLGHPKLQNHSRPGPPARLWYIQEAHLLLPSAITSSTEKN